MAKVMIGCRLPTGVVLDLYEPFPDEIVQAVRRGEMKNPPPPKFLGSVKLNGQNHRWHMMGMIDKAILKPEDFGTTEVDESFWDNWLLANAESPLVKNSIVFVVKKESEAKAIAKDLASDKETRTGFESMSQEDRNISKLES